MAATRRRKQFGAVGILAVGVIGLSACGGGGGSSDETSSASTSSTSVTTTTTRSDTPTLSATLFQYEDAEVGLPTHFTTGVVAAADNTPADNPITDEGATLGRVLFYDNRLSATDTVSCSSCHQQAHGFADPDAFSTGFQGGLTGRHSMGLSNARYYQRGHFFWDERADTLEDQVLMPIQNDVEMGMDLTTLEGKLAATDYYPPLFEAAFGTPEVTSERISLALAQFVRAMVSYRSKFDSAFTNGTPNFAAVFTAQELQGLQLFGGFNVTAGRSLRCDTCHGTAANISDNIHNNGLDADTSDDEGAGNGRFKAPSLRNIGLRPPYMHDGRFATLEEVIDFYSTGIQAHPNLDNRLRQPDGQPRRFNLTEQEKSALLAFLNTLNDSALATDPRFADPFVE